MVRLNDPLKQSGFKFKPRSVVIFIVAATQS
jgi:hypothetical protein